MRAWNGAVGMAFVLHLAACDQDTMSPTPNVPVAGTGGAAAPRLGFRELYAQAFWSCTRSICHGGAVAGLDMSTPAAAHAGLVNQPAQPEGACAFTAMTRVVPFQPDQSLLIGKLQPSAPCGQQMPIGGLLSQEHRDAVRAWIAAGAPFD